MRLARFTNPTDGTTAPTRIGLVEGEVVHELDIPDDMPALLAALPERPPTTGRTSRLVQVRLHAPVPHPPKYLAIGLNYRDHCEETGRPAPDFPMFFNKQTSCVIGPTDDVEIPAVSEMVDYEGELGVVIGRRCRNVRADDALDVVAGYLVVNDVSVRDWQMRSPTMTLGKSFDTHGPLGPWITTPEHVPDPHDLRIRTWVTSGGGEPELLQDTHTSQMIFSIAEQIETLTTCFTLEPGDVLATGTGAGVGIVRTPPRWLRPGDTCRVAIDGLGELLNPVVAAVLPPA